MIRQTVVHATTVHPWCDNRIYEKMVCGLEKRGWNVYYIAREHRLGPKSEGRGMVFYGLPDGGIRTRITNQLRILKHVFSIEKGIFHFHDPELILIGILLRFLGWKVVYDVHEDNKLGILQKHYLPYWSRGLLAKLVSSIEWIAAKLLTIVIAEKSYRRRFPKGHTVLNYPVQVCKSSKINIKPDLERPQLLYTGSISIDRGADLFAELLNLLPKAELTVVGCCAQDLVAKLQKQALSLSGRLKLDIHPQGVSYNHIESYYQRGGWAYGIAVFPRTEHYLDKELTKFFEFIQYGIPIICSNFPTWQRLIKEQGIGVTLAVSSEQPLVASEQELFDRRQWNVMHHACAEVAERYSWEEQLAKLEAIYREL